MRYPLSLLPLTALLASCATTQTDEAPSKNPLSVLVSSGAQDIFDPKQSAQALFTLRSSFFCYPLRMTEVGKLVPDAVREWKWSTDHKTLTLELDPSRRFHNGKAIQATDLEFALVRPYLANTAGSSPDFNVVGSKSVKGPYRPGLIEGIKVLSPTSLSITLQNADPDYIYRLMSLSSQMTPPDAYMDDYATFKETPVSCGDYRITHKTFERYTLEKFRASAEAPAVVELWNYEFDKLPGRPDVMLGGLYSSKKLDKTFYRTVVTSDPKTVFTFVLNDKSPGIKNADFRKAIDLAMPRLQMANSRTDIPTRDFVSPMSPLYLKRPVDENVKEAKRLWESLPSDLRNREYRIYVKTNYRGAYFDMIERNLREVGLKVSVVAKQMKNFKDADENDFLLGVGFVLLQNGPMAMFHRFDGRNPSADPFPEFAQVELQKRLDRYKSELEPASRIKAAEDVARYVLEGNYIIPMSYGPEVTALSPRVASYENWDSGVSLGLLREKEEGRK